MFKKLLKWISGDPVAKVIQQYRPLVEAINALEETYEALSDEELRAKTDEFRRRLAKGETLDDLLPEAFAAVREASKRTIGLRHYDVQLIGGANLHQGKAVEMKTGEGKTLVATLPLYLNALTLNPAWVAKAKARWGDDPDRWQFRPLEGEPVGKGVHLATVNDYLARRDARWMAPIYHLLGMSVGVLQMAARTEHGKKAFLVDLEHRSPQEDQDQLRMVPRREAYNADITYGTSQEFGFDYLRDNMAYKPEDQVQRGHHYVIIDEVDNVLIDEARTPLIISGPANENVEEYYRIAEVVRRLNADEDVDINEKDRSVVLTPSGEAKVEEMLGEPLRDPSRPEDLTPRQEQLWGYLEQALQAQFLYKRNKDYIVQAGKVIIVDENTGRLMPGRRWSHGLHQAIEAKERVQVQPENMTYATITLQNFFRMYEKLAGMSGTVVTEAEEFDTIYNLDVLALPTNLEYQATGPDAPYVALEAVDEEGYKYTYYAHRDDPQQRPVFWKRKDYPDVVYRTEEAKFRSVVWEILRFYIQGRPVLVGTTSVELSERLAARLAQAPLRKLAQILLVRDAFLRQEGREEGRMYPELVPLYEPLEKVPDHEIRKLARTLGLNLRLEDPANLERLRDLLLPTPTERQRWDYARQRLIDALRKGIPHAVLNARKHAEEGQIIARAGEFGAVTIATNMAGRGVDIKLGGELPEEVVSSVNRVLARSGHPDPYNLRMDERYQALQQVPPEEYGIYEDDVVAFMNYIENMHRVRELGGLHVIGSVRHESRRIDNQLRGRAGRQGDPGSSRFFLSLEDELVRLFGGDQLDGVMRRFQVDDLSPIEHPLVNRLIEQAQTRVEGYNFDRRKHILEYDDVLNIQRQKIYDQRNRILRKSDLTEDMARLLEEEVRERLQRAVDEEQDPWQLLAYLETIQPPIEYRDWLFPNFTHAQLLAALWPAAQQGRAALQDALADLAARAVALEHASLRRAAEEAVAEMPARLHHEITERLDALDLFFEGLSWREEPLSLRQLQVELQTILRLPLVLPDEAAQQLLTDAETLLADLRRQIEAYLHTLYAKRLELSLRRLLNSPDLELQVDWNQPEEHITQSIGQQVQAFLESRRERVLESVRRELPSLLERWWPANPTAAPPAEVEQAFPPGPWRTPLGQTILHILTALEVTRRKEFDAKHQLRERLVRRLTFIYEVAQHLDPADPATAEAVLRHLDQARQVLEWTVGWDEFHRLQGTSMSQLQEKARVALRAALGDETYTRLAGQPLGQVPETYAPAIAHTLGRLVQTENYRLLLLSIFNSEWAEYLTEMEALRTSIGLEAYAQRDPLVQYKRRAFELYDRLLRRIRSRAIDNMFRYRTQAGRIQTVGEAKLSGLTLSLPQGLAAGGSGGGVTRRPTPKAKGKKKPKARREPALVNAAAESGRSRKKARRRRKRKK